MREREEIVTRSPLAKWYLTKVRGLKVAYRSIRPCYMGLGVCIYASTWVMVQA